jgi:hypothetical protein
MDRPVSISARRAIGLVALLALAAATAAVAPSVALMVAPALLLLALLVCGVMPGERTLERLLRGRGVHRRRPSTVIARPRLTLVVRRTGRFVTAALAMRPPPPRALVIG